MVDAKVLFDMACDCVLERFILKNLKYLQRSWQMVSMFLKFSQPYLDHYSRTSMTRTWVTIISCFKLELNFLSLDPNFTEIYPNNSNSSLTRTIFRFPSELELPVVIIFQSATMVVDS